MSAFCWRLRLPGAFCGIEIRNALEQIAERQVVPVRREFATRQAGGHFAAGQIGTVAAGAVLRVQRLAALGLIFGVYAVPLRLGSLRRDTVLRAPQGAEEPSCLQDVRIATVNFM